MLHKLGAWGRGGEHGPSVLPRKGAGTGSPGLNFLLLTGHVTLSKDDKNRTCHVKSALYSRSAH